jgi:quercetin dioxygenase-like cupin family protein
MLCEAVLMDEKALEQQLRVEGFGTTYVWEDGPGANYPDHAHATDTAHIILSGEMTLTMNGEAKTYHAGERCGVPAGATHSAKKGPRGCRYLIGER